MYPSFKDMLLVNRSGPAYGYRAPALTFDFGTRKLFTQQDVEAYATALVYWSKHRGSVYRGNRHLAVWGSDFQFAEAAMWFSQMDEIVAEINNHPQRYGAHIQYATLATYFDHVHGLQEPLPVKRKLDFEYGWPHTWSPVGVPLIGLTANFSLQHQTGALSARPTHKRHIRRAAAELRAAQAAHALALAGGALERSQASQLMVSWDALGVAQHHDSMPGTMRAAESVEDPYPDNVPLSNGVAGMNRTTDPTRMCLEDYTRRLTEADVATGAVLRESLEKLAGMPPGTLHDITSTTSTAAGARVGKTVGVTAVGATRSKNGLLVFNPTLHARSQLVRMAWEFPTAGKPAVIPTVLLKTKTGSGAGLAVKAQLEVNDNTKSQQTMSHVPLPAFASALYFIATDVPPLGLARFELSFDAAGKNSTTTLEPTVVVGAAAIDAAGGLGFAGENLRVSFDPADGLMSEVETTTTTTTTETATAAMATATAAAKETTKATATTTTLHVRQTYWQYLDGGGGAYCLIEQAPAIRLPAPFRVALTTGPVMQEVVHTYAFGDGLETRTRIVAGRAAVVDVLHLGGRLPGDRELIYRLETDLATKSILRTEASGMGELYERPLNTTASIAQNYHALVQTAVIRDEVKAGESGRELAVLTRRTMGVASLNVGDLEYMLQRRITAASDNQGPWPLDDQTPMQEEHIQLVVGTQGAVEAARFPLAMDLEHPLVTYAYDIDIDEQSASWAPPPLSAAAAGRGLPAGVWVELMVRLDPPSPNTTFMVHLQNMAGLARVVIPSLAEVLGLPVHGCVETTLTMQQTRAANEAVRLSWPAGGGGAGGSGAGDGAGGGGASGSGRAVDCSFSNITLAALDIRTFTFGVGV